MSPDRIIWVPAMYIDMTDAELRVYSDDGETATMDLVHDGETVARGETFRRPQIGRYTWHDAPAEEIMAIFGAFLSHAVESSEGDARDGWPVLTDAASDWRDALTLAGEGF